MGLIGRIFTGLFGGGRNAIKETAEVFRVNAEANSQRQADYAQAALAQYAAEFRDLNNRTWFDSFVDGINRLVRPVLTISILLPIPITMVRPDHMAVALAALALLPVGYWALVNIVVGFYFSGRMQIKAQDFEKSVANAVARAPQVLETVERFRQMRHDSPGAADTGTDAKLAQEATENDENEAVSAWKKGQ